MTVLNWHTVIIAYRLEDEYGNSPFYFNGHKVILPENYSCAALSPDRFKESEYKHLLFKHSLYEYVLGKTALVYDTGEVLFRDEDVISKSLIRR
jgi:hypothetical protein